MSITHKKTESRGCDDVVVVQYVTESIEPRVCSLSSELMSARFYKRLSSNICDSDRENNCFDGGITF